MDQHRWAGVLRSCRLFAAVPEDDLRRLARSASVRRYRRGQIVFCEGDPSDALLVVVDGSLKAVSTTVHGEELLLAILGEHDTVGEMTIADGGVRSASVSAMTNATVLRLPRDAVLTVVETSPALTRALLASLAQIVRQVTGSAADLVFLDVPRRAAKLLLSLEPPDGSGVIPVPLSQSDMASRIGASRQSLNAALQQFQRRGWINLGPRQVEVRNSDALRRFIGDGPT